MTLGKLHLSVENGGLAVPNFQLYHWAIHLKNLSEWVAQDSGDHCLELVSLGYDLLLLSKVAFLPSIKHQLHLKNNFIVNNVIYSWHIIKREFSINSRYYFLASIADNLNFIASCVDSGFREWELRFCMMYMRARLSCHLDSCRINLNDQIMFFF